LLIFRNKNFWRRIIFIDINSILDVFNTSNTVVFDRINNIIVTIVNKILRNSIFLNRQKINFRETYNVDNNNKGNKVKSNMYSFNTILIRYLQAVIGVINAEKSICRLHDKKKTRSEIKVGGITFWILR